MARARALKRRLGCAFGKLGGIKVIYVFCGPGLTAGD